MTSSEDDGDLEDRLRRALSEAAGSVEPGADGLDKIRERIARRPPRPWLTSVLFGLAERVRNWTWRGHWAWPDHLSRRAEAWWSRLRRGRFPPWGIRPLGIAVALAAVALIASVALGVQPLRDAIHQAGRVLQGDGGPRPATAGTEANGAPGIVRGNGASSPGAATAGTGITPRDTAAPPGAACAAGATATAGPSASLTNATAGASASAVATPAVTAAAAATPAVTAAATATPVVSATGAAGATASAAESAAATAPALTCPVSPTNPATATPTPTATAPVTPTATAPVTPTAAALVTPTATAPVTPTATAPVTPTATAPVTPTATVSSGDWATVTVTPAPAVSDPASSPTLTDAVSWPGDGGLSPSGPPDPPSRPGPGEQGQRPRHAPPSPRPGHGRRH